MKLVGSDSALRDGSSTSEPRLPAAPANFSFARGARPVRFRRRCTETLFRWRVPFSFGRDTQAYNDRLHSAIVDARQHDRVERLTVELYHRHTRREPVGIVDADPVGGRACPHDGLVLSPVRRNARIAHDPAMGASNPQYRLDRQPIEPCCRARVPGPPSPSRVRPDAIDVGRDDVRLDGVFQGLGLARGAVDRVQHA